MSAKIQRVQTVNGKNNNTFGALEYALFYPCFPCSDCQPRCIVSAHADQSGPLRGASVRSRYVVRFSASDIYIVQQEGCRERCGPWTGGRENRRLNVGRSQCAGAIKRGSAAGVGWAVHCNSYTNLQRRWYITQTPSGHVRLSSSVYLSFGKTRRGEIKP